MEYRAGILVRVSTKRQDTDNQLIECMDLLRNRNYSHIKTYTHQVSAHQFETDYLNEIYEDARLGKINILIIWSLDRVSRRGPEHLYNALKRLSQYNCQIISVKENFLESFTDNSMRGLFIYLLGYLAEIESRRKSERVTASLNKLKKRGVKLGRPKGARDKKTRQKTGYLGNKNRKKIGAR